MIKKATLVQKKETEKAVKEVEKQAKKVDEQVATVKKEKAIAEKVIKANMAKAHVAADKIVAEAKKEAEVVI